ncbi:MAG: YbjN domain-containing protein [Candidatus Promineifilaceae bacterium]
MFHTLGKFLEVDQWYPTRPSDDLHYQMTYAGNYGQYMCHAYVHREYEQFIFYAVMPETVPESIRKEISYFLTMANYGIRIGNFEMDFKDGVVRFKTSIDFEGVIVNASLLKNTTYPAVNLIDQYYPGFIYIINDGWSAEKAIAFVEA